MNNETLNELHKNLVLLRKKNGYNRKEVAECIGIEESVYTGYELGRANPNAKELKKLAELYELDDILLGSRFPIETTCSYPTELLDSIERLIADFEDNNFDSDKIIELKKDRSHIIKIRNEAFILDSSNIKKSLKPLKDGTTIQIVTPDLRAEMLLKKVSRILASLQGI